MRGAAFPSGSRILPAGRNCGERSDFMEAAPGLRGQRPGCQALPGSTWARRSQGFARAGGGTETGAQRWATLTRHRAASRSQPAPEQEGKAWKPGREPGSSGQDLAFGSRGWEERCRIPRREPEGERLTFSWLFPECTKTTPELPL